MLHSAWTRNLWTYDRLNQEKCFIWGASLQLANKTPFNCYDKSFTVHPKKNKKNHIFKTISQRCSDTTTPELSHQFWYH